jgi:hypothetical protein
LSRRRGRRSAVSRPATHRSGLLHRRDGVGLETPHPLPACLTSIRPPAARLPRASPAPGSPLGTRASSPPTAARGAISSAPAS